MALYDKFLEKYNLTIELDSLIKSKGGLVSSPDTRGTYRHWLFIELDNGNFVGYWIFDSLDSIFNLLSDSNLHKLITKFSDKEYLISIHSADTNEDN